MGKRIRALRLKRGWTQQQMADRLGLSRVHISDLENGKREAGLIVLQILATGFDLTLAKLLSGL